MREVQLERIFRDGIHDLGGWCIKMNPAGLVGIPDRLVLLPGALIFFVELKIKTGVLSPMQKRVREKLEALGFRVHTLWTREAVDEFLSKAFVAVKCKNSF
jgi:hypothetical protein